MTDFMDLINDNTDTQDTRPPEPDHQLQQQQNPLDPAPVIALFDRFHGEIDRMGEQVVDVTVTNPAENDAATELSLQCKRLVNTLEKKRREVKEPYLNVTRLLDGEVKALRDRLSTIQNGLNRKIQTYLQAEEEKRIAERRRIEEARQKEQARIEAERRAEQEKRQAEARAKAEAEAQARGEDEAAAREAAEQAAMEAAEQVPPAPVVVTPEPVAPMGRTDQGTAKLKTKTVWKLTDFRKLPDACMQARGQMIEKAIAPWINSQIKAGIMDITGVSIFEETVLDTRTTRR